MTGFSRPSRGLVTALALSALLSSQLASSAGAIGLPGSSGGGSAELNACAAERSPIVEREKQYAAVRRSRLGAALGQGLMKGAAFFAGAALGSYLGGFGGHGNSGGSGSPLGGFFNPANLSEAGKLNIPGVTIGPGGGPGGFGSGSSDTRAIAAMAVVVAIVGTVEAYVRLKQQQYGNDTIGLARSIDDDAGHQIAVNRAIATEEAALTACRARQVTVYQQHLSGATNDHDRKALGRDRDSLKSAIQKDVDLTGGVVTQQAGLAKTYTQGRAMAEGKSEAQVLDGQAPAYATAASTTALKLPAPQAGDAKSAAAKGGVAKRGGGVSLPAEPVWTTARASILRSAPRPNGAQVARLTAGAVVTVDTQIAENNGWTAVKTGDASGYLRTADLTSSGGDRNAPRLAPPSNIREHNRSVIAARDQGPDRLKTLLTDVQASRAGGTRFAGLRLPAGVMRQHVAGVGAG